MHGKKILVLALILSALSPLQALADRIAIIGTGMVGGALGPEFAALGHDVIYGSRNPDHDRVQELVDRTGKGSSAALPSEAVAGADFVVLAVPGLMVEEITTGLGDLSGKIIIDPTNPLLERDDGTLGLRSGPSNTELIQALAPEAKVVKAFSTMNWTVMVNPEDFGGPVTVPMAGNSDSAKRRVAKLISGLGLEPIDAGTAASAGFLEAMAALYVNNLISGGQRFEFHLRKIMPKKA